MFNYDDLQVTLTVTPEISPANFYTKEEADSRFLTDVRDDLVYARTKGEWVNVNENYESLLAGFLSTYSFSTFRDNEEYRQLESIPFIYPNNDIPLNVTNENDGYNLWICFVDSIINIDTKQGLSVSFDDLGTITTDDKTYNVYRISGLKAGDYSFIIRN